jgi:hypothetical protein
MQDLGLPHWKIVKRILRYLHGTNNYFFQYSRVGNGTIVTRLYDSNWGGNLDTQRLVIWFVFLLAHVAIT